jgi:hypothetical protein
MNAYRQVSKAIAPHKWASPFDQIRLVNSDGTQYCLACNEQEIGEKERLEAAKHQVLKGFWEVEP